MNTKAKNPPVAERVPSLRDKLVDFFWRSMAWGRRTWKVLSVVAAFVVAIAAGASTLLNFGDRLVPAEVAAKEARYKRVEQATNLRNTCRAVFVDVKNGAADLHNRVKHSLDWTTNQTALERLDSCLAAIKLALGKYPEMLTPENKAQLESAQAKLQHGRPMIDALMESKKEQKALEEFRQRVEAEGEGAINKCHDEWLKLVKAVEDYLAEADQFGYTERDKTELRKRYDAVITTFAERRASQDNPPELLKLLREVHAGCLGL